MKNTFTVKTLVAVGIGAAVFLVLGRFAAIPTPIPNVTINTQYAFLGLICLLFGPIAGLLVGLIGHALVDFTAYGSPWWSWIIASAVFGLILGYLLARLGLVAHVNDGEFGKSDIIKFNVAQTISHAVCWLLVAPILDILIYSEPALKVFAQGVSATIANVLTTGIIGTLLAVAYAKTRTKKGSLSKD